MKATVFLMFHGAGHFRGIYALAKKHNESRRVVIAGHEFLGKEVESQGFEFYGLRSVPFALGFEPWVNTMEKKRNLWLACLRDRWNDRLYHARKSELERMVSEIDPETILIDSWQSTDFVVLYPLAKEKAITLKFIQTMMPTALRHGLPPLNSDALPDEPEKVAASIRDFHRKKLLKNLRENIRYFGKSNDRMLRKWMKTNAIRDMHRLRPALFSPSFENVEELVLAPREFDFPHQENPSRKYLGFLPDLTRPENFTGDFAYWFGSLSQELETGNRQLIFCSFGTVTYERLDVVRVFLNNLTRVIELNPWHCIVTGLPNEFIQSLPKRERMHYFTQVPQLFVLSKASAFICHGGLNSIKEAIYAGVPMVVYPVSADVDHKGNAARVVYHGIGLRGDLVRDEEKEIESKIKELLNEGRFREAMDRMKGMDLRASKN